MVCGLNRCFIHSQKQMDLRQLAAKPAYLEPAKME